MNLAHRHTFYVSATVEASLGKKLVVSRDCIYFLPVYFTRANTNGNSR